MSYKSSLPISIIFCKKARRRPIYKKSKNKQDTNYIHYSSSPDRAGFRVGPWGPRPPPTGGLPPIQFKLINCKK